MVMVMRWRRSDHKPAPAALACPRSTMVMVMRWRRSDHKPAPATLACPRSTMVMVMRWRRSDHKPAPATLSRPPICDGVWYTTSGAMRPLSCRSSVSSAAPFVVKRVASGEASSP